MPDAHAFPILGHVSSRHRSGPHPEWRIATGTCELGMVLIAATDLGLARIELGHELAPMRADFAKRYQDRPLLWDDPRLGFWLSEVQALAKAPWRNLDLPLDLEGTEFQRRVWQALGQIPAGQTRTYGQVASQIDAPKAVRAVGAACGANPVCLAIPCHRVVGSSGALTGFHWGVEFKERLLAMEQAHQLARG